MVLRWTWRHPRPLGRSLLHPDGQVPNIPCLFVKMKMEPSIRAVTISPSTQRFQKPRMLLTTASRHLSMSSLMLVWGGGFFVISTTFMMFLWWVSQAIWKLGGENVNVNMKIILYYVNFIFMMWLIFLIFLIEIECVKTKWNTFISSPSLGHIWRIMVDRLLQATNLMSFCSCLIRLPETPINFLVDYTVISWDWGYSLFLFPFPIPCVRGLKNKYFIEFLEAALVKYLMNDFNRMIICHFESKISEVGK